MEVGPHRAFSSAKVRKTFGLSPSVCHTLYGGPAGGPAADTTPHEKPEAGTVGELGRISNVVHGGAEAINPAQDRISGTGKAKPMQIADDDAAAASIRNVHGMMANAHQNIGSDTGTGLWPQTMADFVKAIREKVAKLLELFEQLAEGPLSAGNLAKTTAQTNENQDSALFSLSPIEQIAMSALRYQDIEPDRVMFLLQDD